ncbi:UNVERIFIED_CONTAM: hypothetical protein FKN15_065149, partial [Acipenser sinensis]
VVACYRHLATSVGGSSDCSNLRDELKRTREKAQDLAVANRNRLTLCLREKNLPKDDQAEMERLWVAFSSSLELFHADMCKVFEMGQSFSLSSQNNLLVQTGMSGATSDIAARALSVQKINYDETVSSVDRLEQKDLEEQIDKVDKMIYDIEMKVNVLRWTVEAKEPKYADPVSNDTSSVAMLSLEDDDNDQCCDQGQVVACYRHLATSVGGSSDCSNLRDELKRTREKAQDLAVANRNRLTLCLREKNLPKDDQAEMECLWVAFSSSLELFHADMCKVFEMGQSFSLSSQNNLLVQTGMSGATSDIAARALSVQKINYDETVSSVDRLEQKDLEEQIDKVDKMIYDIEMKVNVLRWTVEAKEPKYADPVSNDTSSVAMLSLEDDDNDQCCDQGQVIVSVILCGVAMVAVVLSVCVVYLA